MTLGMALLIALVIANYASLLMIAARVRRHVEKDPHGKSEQDWNAAVRNLRKEFDSYRVNRNQAFELHMDNVDADIDEIRNQLRMHLVKTHLEGESSE